MINILKNIPRIDSLKEQKIPKHLAIATRSVDKCLKQEKHRETLGVEKVLNIIQIQAKLNIPILTLQIENNSEKDLKLINTVVSDLLNNEIIKTNKIKIMFIGKWFDLPIAITENIKKIMEQTKDYDSFFFNLMINYDGHDEIFAAVKLLTIKALNKQIDIEKIDKELIKESLYTSYFVPPEIIIQCGYRYSGLLLWDSPGAIIYFTKNKHWLTMDKRDFEDALIYYKKCIVEEEKLKLYSKQKAQTK